MPFYAIDGIVPVVDPTAYVHPTAVLIGDVWVGPGVYIGPAAVLRGDFGRIRLEEGANLQDTCVIHAFPGMDVVVEVDGHIGHGAVLHGCRVGRNALVGMNAVVMDGATVEENAFVAALAFVKAGFTVPRQSLAAGIPAKVLKQLSDEDVAWKHQGTEEYQELARRSRASMVEVQPLPTADPDRPRSTLSQLKPLHETKSG